LNEETLLSILISDTLVLILRPDQQDFQGTAVTVEVARKLKIVVFLFKGGIGNASRVKMQRQDSQHREETLIR
jgi:septum site-determining protein MinD